MDMLEEQNQELEALRSIFYEGELTELDQGPPAHFQIHVKLDQGVRLPEDDQDEEPEFIMDVVYTQDYPNTQPLIEIVNPVGLSSIEQDHILYHLKIVAKEEMEIIAKNRRLQKQRLQEERILAEEEEERKRNMGTPVTTELFMQWRSDFLKEKMILRKSEQSLDTIRRFEKKSKVTGRQLFEGDRTLAKSDMTVVDDGDIGVDLELFENEDYEFDSEDEEENQILAGFSDNE